MSYTVIRILRTQGLPPRLPGSMAIAFEDARVRADCALPEEHGEADPVQFRSAVSTELPEPARCMSETM